MSTCSHGQKMLKSAELMDSYKRNSDLSHDWHLRPAFSITITRRFPFITQRVEKRYFSDL